MSSNKVIASECPICLDTIEGPYNRVVTECGHAFHCACLLQNAAHNGFNCPYCRTVMADEPADEDDDSDDEDDFSVDSVFEDEALTSFRMFQQQINGEEVEEEQVDQDQVEEQLIIRMPDSNYMSQKLAERGITFEDLVMNTLRQEHSHFGDFYIEYDRRSAEVYGQFRAMIAQYRPPAPREQRRIQEEVVDGQHRALAIANMLA